MTAELCSAALPMIGTRISPTKNFDSPMSCRAGPSDPTSNSDSTATSAVAPSSTTTAVRADHTASSSDSGAWNRCSWVTVVNTSAAAYSSMSTPATTPLTTSRWTNPCCPVVSTNRAGMSKPITARVSDDECTPAACSL